jgi:hypothetical protein
MMWARDAAELGLAAIGKEATMADSTAATGAAPG